MSTSRIKDWTSKRAHFRLVPQSILWRDFVTIRVQGMHISDTHLYWCLSWQWHVYFRKFKNLKTKRNKRLSRSGEANVAPPKFLKVFEASLVRINQSAAAKRGVLSTSGRVRTTLQLAIFELPSASVSKRVLVQNFSYENESDLHEN